MMSRMWNNTWSGGLNPPKSDGSRRSLSEDRMNGMVSARLICMMALLIGLTACEQYTEPTPIERESVTFNGRLEQAGVFVGPFPVKNAGAVRVVLNSLVGADTNITAVGGLG